MECIEPIELPHDTLGTVTVRCGNCVPCQVTTSREWSVRGTHEFWEQNEQAISVTLTYNDRSLPPGRTLVHRDVQLFMKRLRKSFTHRRHGRKKLRILGCGEYGDDVGKRPHYHLIIYGISLFDVPDLKYHKVSNKGIPIYLSEFIQEHWTKDGEPMGYTPVQDVTPGGIKYVAGYVTKKLRGKARKNEFALTNPDGSVPIIPKMKRGLRFKTVSTLKGLTWEPAMRKVPYVFSSQRLGYDYFKRHYEEHFSQYGCTIEGKKLPLPKAYVHTASREADKELRAVSGLCKFMLRCGLIPWPARSRHAYDILLAASQAESRFDGPRGSVYAGLSRSDTIARKVNRERYHNSVNNSRSRNHGGTPSDPGTYNRSFDRDSFLDYVHTITQQKAN